MRERKSNRLKEYDYTTEGYYFITICVDDRMKCLGEIREKVMVLNIYGEIVKQQWLWLARQYDYVQLGEFIVMPNHLHGIVGNGRDRSVRESGCPVKSLPGLMGAFKTTSSKMIHLAGLSEFRWHKSFYDHIIRNENDLCRIRQYIRHNPAQWEQDEENWALANGESRERSRPFRTGIRMPCEVSYPLRPDDKI